MPESGTELTHSQMPTPEILPPAKGVLGNISMWWKSSWRGKLGIGFVSVEGLKMIYDGVVFLLDLPGRFTQAMSWTHDLAHFLRSHPGIPWWTDPVVFGAGIALLIWDNRRRHRNLALQPPSKPGKLAAESGLPQSRPYIVAVSYSRNPNLPALGFETANDGEPAYEVSIPDVTMGTAVVTFEGNCPRLAKTEHVFWRVLIKQDTGAFTIGDHLRKEMFRQGVGEILVPIRYKDGNNRWYVTRCRLELNTSVRTGIAVHTDDQQLIPEPETDRQEESTVALSPAAPRPYLEVLDTTESMPGKTPFVFTNRGGDVAHKVQVQPLSMNGRTVTFELIQTIPVGDTKSTLPTIVGPGVLHDAHSWEGDQCS